MNPLDIDTQPFWSGASLLGILANRRKQDGENGVSFSEILKKWGHLSVTVTMGIFLFTEYEAASRARHELETQLANSIERIQELREANNKQDEAYRAMIVEFGRRLDIQRADIRQLQAELTTHMNSSKYPR